MGADPVRQSLRPRRLGIGAVRSTEHRHEDLGHVHFAGERIGDRDTLAGVVDEQFVPGHMLLAHRRRQPPLELAEQLAKTAVRVAVRMDRPIFVPQNHQVHGGTLELQHQRSPVRLSVEARPGANAGIDE